MVYLLQKLWTSAKRWGETSESNQVIGVHTKRIKCYTYNTFTEHNYKLTRHISQADIISTTVDERALINNQYSIHGLQYDAAVLAKINTKVISVKDVKERFWDC